MKQLPVQFDFGLIMFQSAYCGLHYACGMILLKGFNSTTTNFVVLPGNKSEWDISAVPFGDGCCCFTDI